MNVGLGFGRCRVEGLGLRAWGKLRVLPSRGVQGFGCSPGYRASSLNLAQAGKSPHIGFRVFGTFGMFGVEVSGLFRRSLSWSRTMPGKV